MLSQTPATPGIYTLSLHDALPIYNSFGLIIDTSTNNQWPNGPVLWQNPAIDITKPIVDAYNVQSGVAPPAKPSTGTSRPGGTGLNKPATPAAPATKPPANQPKQKLGHRS